MVDFDRCSYHPVQYGQMRSHVPSVGFVDPYGSRDSVAPTPFSARESVAGVDTVAAAGHGGQFS